MNQNAAMPPMAYGGTRAAVRQFDRRPRASRIAASTTPMNRKCPISTPILKNSKATGMWLPGNPASLRPPANPSPCISPNTNATSQGIRAVTVCSPPRTRRISAATNMMLERDRRLHRRWRNVHPPERRSRQGQAVGDRERGHGLDELPAAAHQDEQCQHEQKVVNARQDVLDAEHGVGTGHFKSAWRGLHGKTRGDGRSRVT